MIELVEIQSNNWEKFNLIYERFSNKILVLKKCNNPTKVNFFIL